MAFKISYTPAFEWGGYNCLEQVSSPVGIVRVYKKTLDVGPIIYQSISMDPNFLLTQFPQVSFMFSIIRFRPNITDLAPAQVRRQWRWVCYPRYLGSQLSFNPISVFCKQQVAVCFEMLIS